MTTDSKAVCGGGEAEALEALFEGQPKPWFFLPCDEQEPFKADILKRLRKASAALASTAGAGAGDWQPIKTAPKDGTRLLCLTRLRLGPKDGPYRTEYEYNVGRFDDEAGGWFSEEGSDIDPSHWQPLPAPPGKAPAVPASPRSGAETAHPPAPAEHGVEIREAMAQVIEAARLMPRETPATGGAGTIHRFQIQAGVVWGLDRAITLLDRALSQGGGAGRSEKGEEGRDGLPENWPEVLIRRGVWGRGGEYTKARDTEGTSDLLVQTATMLSADRERRRAGGFQARVIAQMHRICEGDPTDLAERRDRHAEEDAELLQSLGLTREAHHRIVDYVHDRPVGEPDQEMGGTMHTLAGLAAMAGLDMMACGEREFARVDSPEVTAKIRRKRSNRHGRGPLPGNDADLNTAIAPAQSPSTSDAEG